MIDPKAIEDARYISSMGAAWCGSPRSVVVARALLAEHDRQERQRCGTCRWMDMSECLRIPGAWISTCEHTSCSWWQAKDGAE